MAWSTVPALRGRGSASRVAHLPVEVVVHAEKRLRRDDRVHDVVFETFAAQMHVREKIEEHGVVGERAVSFDAIVGHAGRNYEMVVGELKRQDALRGGLFGEDEADAGFVGAGVAVSDVVHLEDEIRAGGD